MKQVYRHDIKDHGKSFRVVAILTQLSIENGEPLFDVDYQDPDYDIDYIYLAENNA